MLGTRYISPYMYAYPGDARISWNILYAYPGCSSSSGLLPIYLTDEVCSLVHQSVFLEVGLRFNPVVALVYPHRGSIEVPWLAGPYEPLVIQRTMMYYQWGSFLAKWTFGNDQGTMYLQSRFFQVRLARLGPKEHVVREMGARNTRFPGY